MRTSSTIYSHDYRSAGWAANQKPWQFKVKYVEHLGKGTYGDVSKVVEVTTGIYYAQNLVQTRSRRDSGAMAAIEKQVKSEVAIMQRLRHDHIASVQFCGLEGNAFRLLMLPIADCDLQVYLDNCVRQNYPRASLRPLDAWFGCLISALAYAHDKSIKHDDIKPSNILIKDSTSLLSDFGSAKDFSGAEGGSISPEDYVAGTPVYRCPESPQRGRKADVFSVGCVFSEMLTVRQQRSLEDYRHARRVDGTDIPNAFRGNLRATNDWITSLPATQQQDRVHVLLVEVIQRMLEKDAEERLDARTVKRRFRGEGELLFCDTCS
ncbi:hypothetical protein CBER1_04623 [Cercospora berteroae]|uniref:Protein kinase domain-containing protein n=1 Tax=Cercospora berteroae TaxID=357750 RepID=A0A2S6C2G2_9PEZI|nr:hypothetical protein CBER1_04623 [Cercospora berteroae]